MNLYSGEYKFILTNFLKASFLNNGYYGWVNIFQSFIIVKFTLSLSVMSCRGVGVYM